MRGDRRLIKRKIIQIRGEERGRGDLRRSGSALSGANLTQLSTQQPLGRTLGQVLPIRGRGGGRGRVGTILEREMAQTTPTTRIPAPTAPNPETPTIMLPAEGEEEEEEDGGSPEVISQMDTPALRVDDLPSDDEEDFQLTQMTPKDNTENMEASEPEKPAKEDRKRTRADSKSPPDSRIRKKSTK